MDYSNAESVKTEWKKLHDYSIVLINLSGYYDIQGLITRALPNILERFKERDKENPTNRKKNTSKFQ